MRTVALAWRTLTGGRRRGVDHCRRTLVACSGGGDSCGLVLALAAAAANPQSVLTVAHIVHDLRPRQEALADRDAAAALAERLDLPFCEANIRVRELGGNAEAVARRLRYSALAGLAEEQDCRYIATAHHAQDQLETLLMALARGAGPGGLRGIAASRTLHGVRLIRPALEAETEDLRRLCEGAGIQWREDATNLDVSRFRAAVRHRIVPVLEELRPGAARAAGRAAKLVSAAQKVLNDRIKVLVADGRDGEGFRWPRKVLGAERGVVVGGVLRAASTELLRGAGGDRLGARRLDSAVRAIRDDMTDPRTFNPAGLRLTVTAQQVVLGT